MTNAKLKCTTKFPPLINHLRYRSRSRTLCAANQPETINPKRETDRKPQTANCKPTKHPLHKIKIPKLPFQYQLIVGIQPVFEQGGVDILEID